MAIGRPKLPQIFIVCPIQPSGAIRTSQFKPDTSLIDMIQLLENVEHCGGEPEQADTACLRANRNAWVPGGGLYVLCVVCPLVLGCQGKACLSTCCLSHGEPLGEGMSVECGYIGMN